MTPAQEAAKLKNYVDEFRDHYNARHKVYIDGIGYGLLPAYPKLTDTERQTKELTEEEVRNDVQEFNTQITNATNGINPTINLDAAAALAHIIINRISALNRILTLKNVPE
ncbi:hypothetical protein [Okeania sp. SIO2B3]|uniref:hypothetical protein n=1 Tax=Okeania sp. SIO2B3 TaxID=2607784 RepID=UPI0013C0CE30|nr:hypothetical protein [Okeania sp. SIO2B3]NET45797.1 hypothetical protein [Okeania sp. SIO2B3]